LSKSHATQRDSPAQSSPSRWQRGVWTVQIGVILAVIWLALTGLDALRLGLFTVVVGAVLGATLVPGQPYPWRPLRLLRFVFYFLYSSIHGGFDVAWRPLTPHMPINPQWLRYRISLPAGQPRTLMVSILSLLPGTLSVDLEDDNVLIVHALTNDDAEGARAAVLRLEQEVAWFFSLPAPQEQDANP
jgi:multicomponent Na+:H+ antiporter subunit E